MAPFLVAPGAWRELLLPYPGSWMEKDKMEEVLKSFKAFKAPSGTENEVQRQSSAPSLLEGRLWSIC